MSKEQIKQTFHKVLTEAWCPESLAEEASNILSKYYPTLIEATDEEVRIVRQATEYVRGE